MAVTFFGHRDSPLSIKPILENAVCALLSEGERDFYVGDSGAFDRMALSAVKSLKTQYPYVNLTVVLSTLPTSTNNNTPTLLPSEVLSAPAKFRIDRRNRWLIDHSTVVVSFVPFPFGGAYKFKSLATKKGRRIIELSELTP